MTALKPRDAERFLKHPDEAVVCALIYGPEQGLVHERATNLAIAVAGDLSDPWRVTSLSDEDAGSAARLTDEAAAQSFLGGRRVVRMRASSPAVAGAIASLLKASEAGAIHAAALVIVEAGDLKKTSALRKACEGSPDAVAIPCYPEGEQGAKGAIRRQLADEGLTLSDEAADLLAEALAQDRGLLRQEVEKLILFKGPRGHRAEGDDEVSFEEASACLAGTPREDSFAVGSLTLLGERLALSKALAEAEASGTSVIGLLRQTQNAVLRLLPAASAMERGEGQGQAMRAIKPPVFFREEGAVKQQLALWPRHRLEEALKALYEAEAACKKTGAPDQALAERALLSLCASVKG